MKPVAFLPARSLPAEAGYLLFQFFFEQEEAEVAEKKDSPSYRSCRR